MVYHGTAFYGTSSHGIYNMIYQMVNNNFAFYGIEWCGIVWYGMVNCNMASHFNAGDVPWCSIAW